MNTTAAFLHDELTKLPMFPRKALEADFCLFPRIVDRELLTTDMLHKYSWCQLIWSLFSSISSKTASTPDITLFISVINGAFLLHCEDYNTMRTCLAIYLNSAQHFQHIFATNGFLLIMPTIMKIYSNMQSNPMLKNAIEFTCQQFYQMHRIPFVLQVNTHLKPRIIYVNKTLIFCNFKLFGSVAPILDSVGEKTNQIDTSKVQPSALFGLLEAMEKNLSDSLRILELVKVNSDSSTSLYPTSSSTTTSTTSGTALQTSGAGAAHDTAGATGSISLGGTQPGIQSQPSYLNAPLGQFSSPASLLTAAGSSSAVLAVSGIQATNLLITSSGALGFNQVATLTAVAAANSGLTTLDPTAVGGIDPAGGVNPGMSGPGSAPIGSASISGPNNPFVSQFNIASAKSANILEQQQQLRSGIKALDFCYDDQSVRFSIIDSINLCVTVVAYATHAFRSNQMLMILDCLIPRYLSSFKEETDRLMTNLKHASPFGDLSSGGPGRAHAALLGPNAHLHTELVQQARAEFALIQKVSVSIKTLVNTSDFLARIYSAGGATSTGGGGGASGAGGANPTKTTGVPSASQSANRHNRSPSIMPDDDSMRFNEDKRGRTPNDLTGDDSYQYKYEFRSPRDTLLNIVSEFMFFSSKRIKELYKTINDPNLKVGQLLDAKAQCRLVEIAIALLKLWEDPSILGGNGLQKYFTYFSN